MRSSIKVLKVLLAIAIYFIIDYTITSLNEYRFIEAPHPTLGWVHKPNLDKKLETKTKQGKKYNIHFKTYQDGFREYGKVQTDKTKILFLGDSFTGGPFTGNDQMYYQIIKNEYQKKFKQKPEIFVYGAGGWGTLQMYLAFEKYYQEIKPDVLVLQTCINDINENSLIRDSYYPLSTDYIYRPHLELNQKVDEKSLYKKTIRFLYENFAIFKISIKFIDGLHKKYFVYDKAPSEKELNISQTILMKFQKIAPDIKLLNIACACGDQNYPHLETWKALAEKSGFRSFIAPTKKITQMLKNGQDLWHEDSCHYTPEANRIWGEEFFKLAF